MQAKPNILLIMNDDMGFSDIGCYGGEIETPNLDRLAYGGLRFSQFYNSPRCSPSRASLLTGLHPHQAGIGILTYPTGPEGYAGNLNRRCVTIAEALKPGGYRCCMSGKWHVASSLEEPSDAWPMQRGFDEFYGTIIGAGSFYFPNTLTRGNENVDHEAEHDGEFFYTDAISDEAVRQIRAHHARHPDTPLFQYVAYTAPHWPFEGRSLVPVIERDELPERPLFWEHEGNAAVRFGRWKLVKEYPGSWELYDMLEDRTETNDIASEHPGLVEDLARRYDEWAGRCGVIPRDRILEMMDSLPGKAFWEEE